jgi:hypothetical protein
MGSAVSEKSRRRRRWTVVLAVIALLGAGTLALGAMRGTGTPTPPAQPESATLPPGKPPAKPSLHGIFASVMEDVPKPDAVPGAPTDVHEPGPVHFHLDFDRDYWAALDFDTVDTRGLAGLESNRDAAPPSPRPALGFRTTGFGGTPALGASSAPGGGGAGPSAPGGGGSGPSGPGGGGPGPSGPGTLPGTPGSSGGLPGLPPSDGPGSTASGGSSSGSAVTLSPLPEPATWLAMIAGFAAAGIALRLRRAATKRLDTPGR